MSDTARRQFMKLTGAGAAGAALGGSAATAGADSFGTTATSSAGFVAKTDSVRIALNTDTPGSGGINLSNSLTSEDLVISAKDDGDGTWSTMNFSSPDFVNVLADFIEEVIAGNLDLRNDVLKEIVTVSDLQNVEVFLRDAINGLNLRPLLRSFDTDQLFTFLAEVVTALGLPGDGQRGGNGAGRQLLNQLGYGALGVQNTFENPSQINDQVNSLQFDNAKPGTTRNLSGWLEGNQIRVETKAPTITDPTANISDIDNVLTSPSKSDWIDLFNNIEDSFVLDLITNVTFVGEVGQIIKLLPTDGSGNPAADYITASSPRLDRIVDLPLGVLNSPDAADFLGFGSGGGGSTCSGDKLTCTANGPKRVPCDNSGPTIWTQIENFLTNDLGLPSGVFNSGSLETFINDLGDALLPGDILSTLSNLSQDSSGETAGFVGSLEGTLLTPIADVLDPNTQWDPNGNGPYNDVIGDLITQVDNALDLTAIQGTPAGNTISNIGDILRGKPNDDSYTNGFEARLNVSNLGGDFDPANNTLTADLSQVDITTGAVGSEPNLIADIVNELIAYINNNVSGRSGLSQVSVSGSDTGPSVLAKGADRLFSNVTIDSNTTPAPGDFTLYAGVIEEAFKQENGGSIGTIPGLLIDALKSLENNNSGSGGGGNQGLLGQIISDLSTQLGIPANEPNNTKIGEFVNQFRSKDKTGTEPVWKLNPTLNLTTGTSQALTGSFTVNDSTGKGTVKVVDNDVTLDLQGLLNVLDGSDSNSVGLNELDLVNELSSVSLSISETTVVNDFFSNQVDLAKLRDDIDNILVGLSSEATQDSNGNDVCRYLWGDDTDGTQSAGNEWENGTDRLSDVDGAGNVQFIAGESKYQDSNGNGDLGEFAKQVATDAADHIENNVGGAANLIASGSNGPGLLNALDNVPSYGPSGATAPLQRLINFLIDTLNTLIDTNNTGNGVIRDFTGAHALELDFTYKRRPKPLQGGDGLSDELDEEPLLLVNVKGDTDTNNNPIIDIQDTTTLVSNLESADVQNAPAVFNFSQFSPDDEVTILDCAAHWREYIFSG